MSSRQQQNSGTEEVRKTLRFDEGRLSDYMTSHVEGFRGPLQVQQFRGGQSNPTYLLEADSGRYVLRRKPPGKLLKSAHAVDREYRVISALYGADFPVPRPYVLCEDDIVIGTAFYIMECVEGRIFWELDLPGLAPDERTAIYDSVNDTIAKLHSFDYAALGLQDFGKPGNYFARQISRWSGQYRASETRTIEAMDRLIEWLPEHIPDDDSASIVHGDFRLDNMIIHPDEPRVIAVLDWELSTIGHPLPKSVSAPPVSETRISLTSAYPRKTSTPGFIVSAPGVRVESPAVNSIPPSTFSGWPRSCRALPAAFAMGRRPARMPGRQSVPSSRLPPSAGNSQLAPD
jgi:aminoglycoside phosphotransferase (APT) family kinase protein